MTAEELFKKTATSTGYLRCDDCPLNTPTCCASINNPETKGMGCDEVFIHYYKGHEEELNKRAEEMGRCEINEQQKSEQEAETIQE